MANKPISPAGLAGAVYNATPLPLSDTQQTPLQVDSQGNLKITTTGTPPGSNAVRGAASTAGGTATEVIPAPASGSIYVTDLQFGNSSQTLVTVALNDTATSTFVVPSAGGSNVHLGTPLKVAATTHLTFTSSSPQPTIYANAQGYTA